MLPPSTILRNRYRIIQLLGHGGMGAVYQAIDENLNRLVAVKESFGSSEELRRAFRREAELLGNLRHRALPKSIEHFTESNNDYFVMEFVPGHDLAELLKLRGSPFPESEVLGWADEVLAVLAYLHGKGLIHRDIKPSNIKLTKEGELFLIDFGLAKGAVGQMGTLVTSQSVRGYTPAYASLEQILGQGTDARSDIYSVGATFYHLLAGVAPVNASTRFQRIDDEEKDPLPLIQHENPLVSPHVAGIIHSAMAINRKRRPESAEQMREALRAHKTGEHAVKTPGISGSQPGPTQPSPTQPSPTQPSPTQPSPGQPARSNPASPAAPVVATMPVSPPPRPAPAHTNRIFAVEDVPLEETKHRRSFLKPALIVIGLILLVTGASVAAVVLKTGWAPWSDRNLYDPTIDPGPSPSPVSVVTPTLTSDPALPATVIDANGIEFVLIKPGSFLMGSADGNPDEKPQHMVRISSPFYMGRYEVTQAQWRRVTGSNPSYYQDCGDNCPAENVSWLDVQEFVRSLNQKNDEYQYRLPSEAEWEYACRAGTAGSHSVPVVQLKTAAWYSPMEMSLTGERLFPDDFKPTHAVGAKQPNAFGLYDMHGNVSEWCDDWYHSSYNGAPIDGSARLGHAQFERVLRGGSSFDDDYGVRSARRYKSEPNKTGTVEHNRFNSFGLRLVLKVRTRLFNPSDS